MKLQKLIDFRSDTVTQPTREMRLAMTESLVGDDVFGDDPTVKKLEKMASQMFGFDAAIFTTSGTQANLMALLTHCQRGEEIICGDQMHVYRWEAGGASVLGGVHFSPLPMCTDGTINLDLAKNTIKPDDPHFPISRLLCIENTHNGTALPNSYLLDLMQFKSENRNISLHLDGARIFNASEVSNKPVDQLAAPFDSVSFCLSKGLGAPMGSVLCGSEDFIEQAKRWRKMLGGGLRQTGVVASAGIFALENNIKRLSDDHDNANYLAEELSSIDEIEIVQCGFRSNMLFVKEREQSLKALGPFLRKRGFLIGKGNPLRLVTHLDITRNDCIRFVKTLKTAFTSKNLSVSQ